VGWKTKIIGAAIAAVLFMALFAAGLHWYWAFLIAAVGFGATLDDFRAFRIMGRRK
jgi:hypothetical protein